MTDVMKVELEAIKSLHIKRVKLQEEEEQLKKMYVAKHTKFLKGDKLKLKSRWGKEEHVIVNRVDWSEDSTLPAHEQVSCYVYTKWWEKEASRRYPITFDGAEIEEYQILEHIKKEQP